MRTVDLFPPTPQAALTRLAAVDTEAYASSRNALQGAVSRLSPYITHGLISPPEVVAQLAARHPLRPGHKLLYELGWREYFQQVWHLQGDGILRSLHPGPLPDEAYLNEVPADVRQARSGLPVIDQAVRELYASGYLHNHARMWLASYLVHLRKVHWRAGADWLLSYLLDGDLASNHLSWQWVAGTGSHQPYLFNAANVARNAPADWHSPDSVIDTSYAALDAIARSPGALQPQPGGPGVETPRLSSSPPRGFVPHAADVAGRDVWLIHPWALGPPPNDLPANCLLLGWWPSEHHQTWPWSPTRWAFVGRRMSALTRLQWLADRRQLAQALTQARSVQTLANGHVSPWLPGWVRQRPAPRLFAHVERSCHSFSSWWKLAMRGVRQLSDLPGLAQLPVAKTDLASRHRPLNIPAPRKGPA